MAPGYAYVEGHPFSSYLRSTTFSSSATRQ